MKLRTRSGRGRGMPRSALALLGLALVLGAIGWTWRSVLLAPHPIVSGDLYAPLSFSAVLDHHIAFWNPLLEFPNLETIDRLAFYGLFLPLADPASVQKAMIVILILGAGASMFLSARRLAAPWLLAVLAGIAYACNPWIAMRLHHLLILPGYVALPAVVALWIRPPRRAPALWLVLALTLGSTTPHTTVALWFVLSALAIARPSAHSARRFARAALTYAAVNVWWWVPVITFMAVTDLVPSWPTMEQVELFSRNAGWADVLRLDGYWWPFVDVELPLVLRIAGLGLVGAAVWSATTRPDRERVALGVLAICLALLAMGTRGPTEYAYLVVEGPAADRVGWLFRDPNKAVGALAGILILFAAGARGVRHYTHSRASVTTRAALMAGYLTFAIPSVTGYISQAYIAHPVPEGLQATVAWLNQASGRAAYVPAYFGAQTFWNGDNFTPEFLSNSSPVPALAPYNYDERARRAFLTLDFGAVLQDLPSDVAALMRRWGVRYLVHHRDVKPGRLQPAGSFDPRVELRSLGLNRADLPVAASFAGTTVFEVPVLPDSRTATPMFAQRPTATAAALANFGAMAESHVTTDRDHPALERVLLLPGDEPTVALATAEVRLPLAEAAPHATPSERWSRIGETELGWWPALAVRGGMPPEGAPGLIWTSHAGAVIETDVDLEAGEYGLWVRGYVGPSAGRVELSVADASWTLDLREPAPRMQWFRIGALDVAGGRHGVVVTNLHGDNVLADGVAVPVAAEVAARIRLQELSPAFVWTQTDACRTRDPAMPVADQIDVDRALPLDQPLSTGRTWGDYSLIEVDILGRGDGRIVEAWTNAGGRWIQLGEIHVWWSGWRRAFVSVERERFEFAPLGTTHEAELLRLLESGGPISSQGFAEPLEIAQVSLFGSRPCTWTVDVPHAGRYVLQASDGETSFSFEVDGASYNLTPLEPSTVALPSGSSVFRFPAGVPSDVNALWLAQRPLEATASPNSNDACPTSWRLQTTNDRYVEGLWGKLGDTTVTAVPVDGLMAGYWLPPGSCGAVAPVNPWITLGRASMAVSGVAALALCLMLVFARVRSVSS